MENLFDRLAAGETAEAIAKEFSDKLNEAEKQYADFQKKEESKKKEKEYKKELVQGILDAIYLYYAEFFPENEKIFEDSEVDNTFVDILDFFGAYPALQLEKLFQALDF